MLLTGLAKSHLERDLTDLLKILLLESRIDGNGEIQVAFRSNSSVALVDLFQSLENKAAGSIDEKIGRTAGGNFSSNNALNNGLANQWSALRTKLNW